MSGFWIAVEGLDGCGKTTLCQRLSVANGGVMMATPGEAFRPLRQAVHAALDEHVDALPLFYASTVVSAGHSARRLASEGGCVVMDRYWPSTVAYAMARGSRVDLGWLGAMVPAPDLFVLLELPEAVRRQRLERRGMLAADRETLQGDMGQRIMDAYRDLMPEHLLVPADLSIEDQMAMVMGRVVEGGKPVGP